MNNPTVVFPRSREVVIEDRAVPEPGPGELLIRTRRSMISTGTELTILDGEFPAGSMWEQHCAQYPVVPGYSNIGIVVKTGADVSPDWVGKRVTAYCPHARYVKTKAERARLVPDGVDDDQAVFFALAEITMNGVRRGSVQWGEAVVVYGMGLIGQLTARLCRLCGARPVFAVDVAQERLNLLTDDAAIVPLLAQRDDVYQRVKDATRGRMADVVFEATGAPALLLQQVKLLRRQGRLVILSSPRGKVEFDFHDDCNWPSLNIIGAHNSSHPEHATLQNPWTLARHNELFFDLALAHELQVAPLISHRASFTEAPALYQMLLHDRSQAMGVILEWAC